MVTNRTDLSAEDEYDYYVERGDAECRIDELKNGCFCDRTSYSSLAANQFRLMLSMAAVIRSLVPGVSRPQQKAKGQIVSPPVSVARLPWSL